MPQIPIPAEPGKKLDWIINNPAEHRVVEQIECEDGHLLSVQASGGHYCTWRHRLSSVPAKTVEVKTEGAPAGWEASNIDGPGGGGDTYGWISVEEVRAFIASHGGEKGSSIVTVEDRLARIEALLMKIAQNTAPSTATLTMTSTTVDPAEIARTIARITKETA